jgi:hypothetical protein
MPVPGIAADPPRGALRLVDGWLRTLLPAPAKHQGMSSAVLWIRIRSDRQHFPGFGSASKADRSESGSVLQPNVKINYSLSGKLQYAV